MSELWQAGFRLGYDRGWKHGFGIALAIAVVGLGVALGLRVLL